MKIIKINNENIELPDNVGITFSKNRNGIRVTISSKNNQYSLSEIYDKLNNSNSLSYGDMFTLNYNFENTTVNIIKEDKSEVKEFIEIYQDN